jgi:NitT/TauT family transport system substrate-binding protein
MSNAIPIPSGSAPVSRRRAMKASLGALAVGGATLALPALAQSERAIRLTLPWLANGSTLFTYVAKNRGFFKKRGLDVNISRGFGSVAAAQALSAGEFDFGFVFAGGVILGAARGLPLVGLSTLGYDATMGIAVRADSAIKTPRDLEGKKIGTVPTSAESPYWLAFARKAGVDTSKVTLVQMDSRVLEQALVNKQVDAITAIGTSSVPVMLALKQPCRFMLWSKAGVNLYAGQVVTRRETLAKDPGLCQAVVQALEEGLAFTLRDPEASIDIFLKEVPELAMTATGKDNARISQGLMHFTVLAQEATTNGLGHTDLAKAADMVDMVMAFGAPRDAKKPEVASLYTNKFAGSVKLSAGEWEAVRKSTAPYASILG